MSDRVFSRASIHHAALALDRIFQGIDPTDALTGTDPPDGATLDEAVLISLLQAQGIPRALTSALLDHLVDSGVLAEVKRYLRCRDVTPLGGGPTIDAGSWEYKRFRFNRDAWLDYIATPTPRAPGEGGVPGAKRREGIPLAEAEIRVSDWLRKHAKDNPASITRDAVVAGTDVSAGQVSKTAAWKAFRKRRDAEAKPGAREVPLTDAMQAVLPGNCEMPDELAALIEEQKADEAKENRRHKRRHKPS